MPNTPDTAPLLTAPAPAGGGPAPTTQRPVVGRQPVVDTDGRVTGFALVHGAAIGAGDAALDSATDPALDPAVVTVELLLTTLDVGLDELVGGGDVWCPVDRGVLLGTTPLTLPPARSVLVVEAADLADEAAREGCRCLRAAGHRVALRGAGAAPAPAALALADVVEVDVRHEPAAAAALARAAAGLPLALVAVGCTTLEEVERAQALGCTLFQGPSVPTSRVVRSGSFGASALTQTQLAVELLRPDLDLPHVEAILRPEPGLTVQLLEMAGAGAAGGLRRQVRSLREAMVLLGTDRLRQWAALTVLGRQRPAAADALTTALVRARSCELMAQRERLDPAAAFTAGLLSALDLILGLPVEDLEAGLALDADLAAAAFRGEGALGGLVARCRAWEDAVARGERPDAGDLELLRAMAFCWAASLVAALEGSREATRRAG